MEKEISNTIAIGSLVQSSGLPYNTAYSRLDTYSLDGTTKRVLKTTALLWAMKWRKYHLFFAGLYERIILKLQEDGVELKDNIDILNALEKAYKKKYGVQPDGNQFLEWGKIIQSEIAKIRL